MKMKFINSLVAVAFLTCASCGISDPARQEPGKMVEAYLKTLEAGDEKTARGFFSAEFNPNMGTTPEKIDEIFMNMIRSKGGIATIDVAPLAKNRLGKDFVECHIHFKNGYGFKTPMFVVKNNTGWELTN